MMKAGYAQVVGRRDEDDMHELADPGDVIKFTNCSTDDDERIVFAAHLRGGAASGEWGAVSGPGGTRLRAAPGTETTSPGGRTARSVSIVTISWDARAKKRRII